MNTLTVLISIHQRPGFPLDDPDIGAIAIRIAIFEIYKIGLIQLTKYPGQ